MKSRIKISQMVLAAVLVFMVFVAPAMAERTVIKGPSVTSAAPHSYGVQTALTQDYEYISGSSWVGNADGRMTLSVDVAITEVGIYGDGEYVNAWVDWDDSGTFGADEQVMDLLKYAEGPNQEPGFTPPGTLHYGATFQCENTGTHWTRVNLGYDYDPPSGADTWDFGDIVDAKICFASCIPEFTTIAIPVASILGLLFFFNYRKRRREQ